MWGELTGRVRLGRTDRDGGHCRVTRRDVLGRKTDDRLLAVRQGGDATASGRGRGSRGGDRRHVTGAGSGSIGPRSAGVSGGRRAGSAPASGARHALREASAGAKWCQVPSSPPGGAPSGSRGCAHGSSSAATPHPQTRSPAPHAYASRAPSRGHPNARTRPDVRRVRGDRRRGARVRGRPTARTSEGDRGETVVTRHVTGRATGRRATTRCGSRRSRNRARPRT